ncbi:MAG: aldo/keto reductase [Candidatus Omnitrophica bacterium]|nr:aldo/keto reductase [Candidatus Omnitrophota bacterium]
MFLCSYFLSFYDKIITLITKGSPTKYTKLRNSEIKIPRIALGTWVYSGDVWGKVEETECIQTINTALDLGINMIDTAPIYGYGASEIIIGKAVKPRRKEVILATKCGLIGRGADIKHNLSKKSILTEVETSLKRLQTDYIDIYQCHWPDSNTPIEETMSTLLKLKEQGKVRFIGVSNFTSTLLEEAEQYTAISTLQNQYSILDRTIETKALPYTRKHKINVFCYGPLAGGILTGKYKTEPEFKGADTRNFFYKYYHGDVFKKVTQMVDTLRSFGKPLNQVAINWLLAQEGISTVLVGCRNVQQLKQNAEAADWELTSEQLRIIDEQCKII